MKPLAYAGSLACWALAVAALVLWVMAFLDKVSGVNGPVDPPGPALVFWVVVFAFGWAGSRLWTYAETDGRRQVTD